ncbi:MAG: hypothetical protein WD801_03530 [Gemmatimonadaceae bacterium]
MHRHRMVLTALATILLGGSDAWAQGGMGGRMSGGMGGMMGGRMRGGDSASAAIMSGVHEMLMNHDKIRRTVINLPNGVRTVTESDDPRMAEVIKSHVASTGAFVATGVDPNLPMSTAALHGVLRNGTKIARHAEVTPSGVIVTETSGDSATVALLQAHAAEITGLVERGMAAMREAMMSPANRTPPAAMPTHEMPTHETTAQARPTRAGQEAFATIGEIVRILDADPRTDWSRVDLEALRQHLIDMDNVTMRAVVQRTDVPGGAAFDVHGTGAVRVAIRRMSMSHGATVTPADGFTWQAVETPDGARVTVLATDAGNARMVARIRALGFVGVLTIGDHHTVHHLGIADGSMRGSHRH